MTYFNMLCFKTTSLEPDWPEVTKDHTYTYTDTDSMWADH
jgi:hypothetical protein